MIVKFKSVIMEDEQANTLGVDKEIFNNYFKGKYCYMITGYDDDDSSIKIYTRPFNNGMVGNTGLTVDYYTDIEMSMNNPYKPNSEDIFMVMYSTTDDNLDFSIVKSDIFSSWTDFIDTELTEKVNSVDKLIGYNSFEPDADLTIDELRRFRTWLAETLYNIYNETDTPDETLNMLNYYKNEMSDDATHLISLFNESTVATIPSTHTGCGCGTFDINLTNLSVCDILAKYRSNIHDYMVTIFSDIMFWLNADDETDFLVMFKKYIDAIILNDFPLYAINPIGYGDCACLSDQASSQEQLMMILKNLSKSLGYMIDGTYASHKNFIYQTLNTWSNSLYEIMRW